MYGDGMDPSVAAPLIEFANHIKAIREVLRDKLLKKDAWTMQNDE